MTTKEAVDWVLADTNMSKYALAKELNVGPIMISRYVDGLSRFGPVTAQRMYDVFGVKATDVRVAKRNVEMRYDD